MIIRVRVTSVFLLNSCPRLISLSACSFLYRILDIPTMLVIKNYYQLIVFWVCRGGEGIWRRKNWCVVWPTHAAGLERERGKAGRQVIHLLKYLYNLISFDDSFFIKSTWPKGKSDFRWALDHTSFSWYLSCLVPPEVYFKTRLLTALFCSRNSNVLFPIGFTKR